MKKDIVFLLVSLFSSCSSMQVIENGTFKWANTKYNHTFILTLNEDHTFHLIESPYKISCEGSWNYIDQRTIKIACFEPKSAIDPITRGYMHERVRIIKVKCNDKLKMPIENNVKRKHVILKKVKEK